MTSTAIRSILIGALIVACVHSLHAQDSWLPTGGPLGGPLHDLAVSSDGTIYAVGAHLFQSNDNGVTWRRNSLPLPPRGGVSVAVAGTDTIYVQGEWGALYRSIDRGRGWSRVHGFGDRVLRKMKVTP